MGKRLTTNEETQLLRDTIRQAHEATQAPRAAIKEANALSPALVEKFNDLHKREMHQLSNHINAESNRAAAELNIAVEAARQEVIPQLMLADLVLDPDAGVVRVLFNGGRFDDQQPVPYPNHQPPGDTQ